MRPRPCRQVKREEVAVCRNPMDVVFDPAEQKALFNTCSKNSAEGTELDKLQSFGQEEKRRKLGKKIGMMRERPMGGMRVLR